MARRKESEMVEKVEHTIYYICDACDGENHEETEWEDDLNRLVMGDPFNTVGENKPRPFDRSTIEVEEDYLVCDECLSDFYDHVSDFF